MKTRILLPVLMLSAVFVSPASANFFSNPTWNIILYLGSAPNPTPEDIRSGRMPTLVQDSHGDIIAMIDPSTGKVIATAEPPAPVQPNKNGTKVTPAAAPAR